MFWTLCLKGITLYLFGIVELISLVALLVQCLFLHRITLPSVSFFMKFVYLNCFSGDVEGELLFHFFLSGLIFAILPLSVYYLIFFVEETTEYLAKPFAETYTRRQVFEGLFLSLRRTSCFTVANCRSKTALLSRLEFLMTSDHKGTKCR